MASNDPNHRRGHSTPQSIPLKDLTRPPGSRHPRRRTLSERGRELIRGRESWTGPYEAIAERDPSPTTRPTLRVVPPNSSLQAPPQYNVSDASPLEDVAAFQEAI